MTNLIPTHIKGYCWAGGCCVERLCPRQEDGSYACAVCGLTIRFRPRILSVTAAGSSRPVGEGSETPPDPSAAGQLDMWPPEEPGGSA